MLVTTTKAVPGHAVRGVLGPVFGVVVRSRGIGGNITAGLRSIIGGEIPEYMRLVEESRRQAIDRMVSNAALMGGLSTKKTLVRVWFNPTIGERRYVADDSAPC